MTRRYTAFEGHRVVAVGALLDVALAVKTRGSDASLQPILVFDDATGAVVDLDLRGSAADIAARLGVSDRQNVEIEPHRSETDARGRGRPKLGVVAREVTLLPRQWDWLASQPGGASQTLRRLVDEGRRSSVDLDRTRSARANAYRFMAAIAGNLPGFEEATRALFAGDRSRFEQATDQWPIGIRTFALGLAGPGL